jgi:hypothetical protein
MKKWDNRLLHAGLVLGLLFGLIQAAAQDHPGDKGRPGHEKRGQVMITPEMAEAKIGDSVQFMAQILDENNNPVETEFAWTVQNRRVGIISETGLFTATGSGHTLIMATAGKSTGRAEVIVLRDSSWHDRPDGEFRIVIEPHQS